MSSSLRRLCLCILSAALPGLMAPLAAHPVLTFVVASHVEVSKGPPQPPTDETFPLIVTLGRQFLASGDMLKTDSRVIKFAGALAKHEPAQLAAAADELSSLRAETNVRPEIIGLFEGNVRLEMRQVNQGEQLLLAAVKKDPYLTSAWHDLADYYYRSFRTPEA